MIDKAEPLDARQLERIQGLMREVVRKSALREGTCVFRGEPQCYPVVSSGLFRKCPDVANEGFDIGQVEQEIAENARQYTTLTEEVEILTEIQHFGGATNLIDFTDDYLIALFFACVGAGRVDGRVVLHRPEPDTLVRPKQTINRVVFQKSVFVRPRRGFIVPDAREETVVIPGDLKGSILSFLERFHGISERTVFNDIHGFIRHQTPGQSRYAREFRASSSKPRIDMNVALKPCFEAPYLGVELFKMRHAFHQRGIVYEDQERSMFSIQPIRTTSGPPADYMFEFEPDQVVDLFTHLIQENMGGPQKELYCRRGEAHLYQGETDLAIRDFDEALALDAEMAAAYHGRSNAHRLQGNADRASADLQEAFCRGGGVPAACIDRGNAHRESGLLEDAVRDFDAAISSLKHRSSGAFAELGDGYFYRAVARCVHKDWAGAKNDLLAARQEGVLVATSFRNTCAGVPGFESKYGLTLPSVIATMLYVA